MNIEDIHCLPYYFLPKEWTIHLINPKTDEKQLNDIQQLIENGRLFAFDTETMPSFYQRYEKISKPSLLQVAIRDHSHQNKNVLLFDLQELFDQSYSNFQEYSTRLLINHLIKLIFNHTNAYKLSQSLFNDLAQLKCSYNEDCFQKSKLNHLIELSDIYRRVFSNEKYQTIYGLQRMTLMTLHCQLNKQYQCANWSKRPLPQTLKDYAAIDVIVMIDIYERLKYRIEQEQQWEIIRDSILTSIDLNQIHLYSCLCGERFLTNKTRNKHMRTCFYIQNKSEKKINGDDTYNIIQLDSSRGRGYIPPALKHAYQSFQQPIQSSFNENHPLNAKYFLDDDDSEVAEAFGLVLENTITKSMIHRSQPKITMSKENLKIAAYPPKIKSISAIIVKEFSNENDLIDRLQDDFDSQPEFHCHLFGLGGRGRSLSTHLSSYEPLFTRRYDYKQLQNRFR